MLSETLMALFWKVVVVVLVLIMSKVVDRGWLVKGGGDYVRFEYCCGVTIKTLTPGLMSV